MLTDEIARGFDDRPGFDLVDFEEVGLPVYRLTSTVLTLQPKAYSPIEEFVLRAIEAGLENIETVTGFLGISASIVEATATTLIKDDDLIVDSEGILHLTQKSQRILAGENLIRPREQSLVFHYDGLTRKPIRAEDLWLWDPRDLKDRGIREIRAFPPKRPRPEEIRGDELQAVLRGQVQASEPSTQILQVKSISRAFANFIPALALIYRRTSGTEVQVGFAIDGRLSHAHESAFAAYEGPARMGITTAILGPSPAKPDVASAKDVPSKAQREKSIAKLRAEVARKSENKPDAPGEPRIEAQVEMVAVYDHPKLLREALAQARQRLIIISPWITDAVVDRPFLAALGELLRKGVDVHIGYGLGVEERIPQAIRKLEQMARDHANFRLVRLGDTHAKILIKDEDWLVATSFNWLSFRGDPKRTFREEWGTRIAIPGRVREQASTILKRLDAATRTP
jgi:hypothetical protein